MKLEISVQFRGFLSTCILIMQNAATLGALELEIAPWWVQSYILSQLIDIVWNVLIIIVCYTLRSQWLCVCGVGWGGAVSMPCVAFVGFHGIYGCKFKPCFIDFTSLSLPLYLSLSNIISWLKSSVHTK